MVVISHRIVGNDVLDPFYGQYQRVERKWIRLAWAGDGMAASSSWGFYRSELGLTIDGFPTRARSHG